MSEIDFQQEFTNKIIYTLFELGFLYLKSENVIMMKDMYFKVELILKDQKSIISAG